MSPLIGLDSGIDLKLGDVDLLVLSPEIVETDDDLVTVLDGHLGAVGRLGDLRLHVALLDGGGRTAQTASMASM